MNPSLHHWSSFVAGAGTLALTLGLLGMALPDRGGQKKADGGFDLSQAPSHLLRRCVQYANDLFSQEPGASDLTKRRERSPRGRCPECPLV